jgi:hypothetical protein
MNTCSNPQLKSWNYNKINTNVGNGDGDVDVDDGDDAQASKNYDGGEDRCPASSPFRPLPEVRFI